MIGAHGLKEGSVATPPPVLGNAKLLADLLTTERLLALAHYKRSRRIEDLLRMGLGSGSPWPRFRCRLGVPAEPPELLLELHNASDLAGSADGAQ